MDRELIKKFKDEFYHWLNGGSVLDRTIDYEDHMYSDFKEISKTHN